MITKKISINFQVYKMYIRIHIAFSYGYIKKKIIILLNMNRYKIEEVDFSWKSNFIKNVIVL